MIKRILLCILLVSLVSSSAMAATNNPVIIQLGPLGSVLGVLNVLGGTVLDQVPGTTIYLVNLNSLPVLGPLLQTVLNIVFLEPDKQIPVQNRSQFGIMQVAGTTAVDFYKTQPDLLLVRANLANTYSTGRGIVVADLNSQVDYAHPALVGHLTSGYDFVSGRSGYQAILNQSSSSFLDQSDATFLDQSEAAFLDQSDAAFLDQSDATFLDQSDATFLDGGNPAHGHGTLCAGIIAAVAPNSMIMPLRVFDDSGNADVFSIVKATYWAVNHGARVINMSFGLSSSSSAMQTALAYAASHNVQVVAAAGNANSSTPQFPASVSSVISVAATDLNDVKAAFSNYGSTVYVDAPGVNVISAYPGGYYALVSGTSFSAPIVAAETALVMSVKTSTAKTIVGNATVNIYAKNPSYVNKLGHGRVDLLNAVK
jgi:subtilisin family serine protease